ncbi:MAG: hypothetical protein ABSH46_17140 [Bryobacteraceae bacterium]|jgi:predicted RNA binding protein YcfA (HicA-like mRNA interferase family)
MSEWPATKARRVLAALQRIGWRIVRTSGSHRTLRRVILSEIAKGTGLCAEDL